MESIAVAQFIHPHGDEHKRLKLSELVPKPESSHDRSRPNSHDASPPRPLTPLPAYEKFRGSDGRFHFDSDEQLYQFITNHVKDLNTEDYVDFSMSILGLPKWDPNMPRLIVKCGELALAFYKDKHGDDYEYASDGGMLSAGDSIHLNFYARRKASESNPDPGPRVLFFADMESEDEVKNCCIIDPESPEAQCLEAEVIHPPNMHCTMCEVRYIGLSGLCDC